MQKVRLGIIGCGIATNKLHWPALSALADKFEIVAVCNHTEQKAAEFAKVAGGVPYVLDYRDLLAREDVEAVDIVLPIHLNCRVTKDALEAGKHVVLEKPIAANLSEARRMLSFPRRYRRVMMVAENCRYQPVFLQTRQALQSGLIGRAYAVVWDNFSHLTSQNPYTQTRWRIHHQYAGGFLTDAGVHNMAVLRMLFGEFKSVTGFTRKINPALGKLDTLGMIFETRSGVSGSFNLYFSTIGVGERRLMIFGTTGTIVVSDHMVVVKRPGEADRVIAENEDAGYKGEFEDFYEAIRNGATVQSTFRESARDLQVILAALEAADAGRIRAIKPLNL